jgi:hypothetical protein
VAEERYSYHIQLPLLGRPDEWYTVVRCLSASNAVEVIRVLLDQSDTNLLLVRVEIRREL